MLTNKQESLIIACLLGDGYISKHIEGQKNPKLEIQHSEKQKDYLMWKRDLLERHGLKVSKVYSVGRNGYEAYRFRVDLTKEDGLYLRHRFYPNENKTITRHDLNKLDELGLAIWFMDDGCRRVSWDKKKNKCTGRSLHLATHSYTYEENVIIKNYFKVVWNIEMNIRRDGKHYYLAINATNAKKFIPLIKPYMLESLLYKIDLKYIEK